MKLKLPSTNTVIGFGLYAFFGYALAEIAGPHPTTMQWLAIISSLATFVFIDVRSYQMGLERGSAIAHEVLDDLLSKLTKDRS